MVAKILEGSIHLLKRNFSFPGAKFGKHVVVPFLCCGRVPNNAFLLALPTTNFSWHSHLDAFLFCKAKNETDNEILSNFTTSLLWGCMKTGGNHYTFHLPVMYLVPSCYFPLIMEEVV